MRSELVAASVLALVVIACAREVRTTVPLASPETLDVVFESPTCERAETPASIERVIAGVEPMSEARRFWRVRGCFPVRLSGAPACEWACVLAHGGPCGNGGSHEVLALIARGHVVGRAGIRDSEGWYRRDFRVDDTARGRVLEVGLQGGPGSTRQIIESYRLTNDELVCLDAKCSSVETRR